MSPRVASLIALALAATVGTASAQSGYAGSSRYDRRVDDRYGQASGGDYDYADVVRVDPVFDRGHGTAAGYPGSADQRCYIREDGYVGGGRYGDDGYGGGGYGDGSHGRDVPRSQGSEGGRTVATVIGGVLGAVVGSQVGGGSARYATSAIGSMVGGIAGREVYEANQRNRYPSQGRVTVCDPVPTNQVGTYRGERGVDAYDVTYEYAGRRYTTRTNDHPGDRIRVRVDVRAE